MLLYKDHIRLYCFFFIEGVGGGGICFLHIVFFFVDFWMWAYVGKLIFLSYKGIFRGCPYLFFFGRGSAKAAF